METSLSTLSMQSVFLVLALGFYTRSGFIYNLPST